MRISRKRREVIPLAGPDYAIDFVSAQANENIYPEAAGASARPVLRSIPGTQMFCSLEGEGRGMHAIDAGLITVVGDVAYVVRFDGTSKALGTVPGTGLITMTDNGDEVAMATGLGMYVADATTLTLVSDPDRPINAIAIAFLDSYVLAIGRDTQVFQWSELDDPTAWDALDFASAEGSPDKLVGMQIDHREIWLAGTDSMEIWFNDGTTPFSRTSGGFIEKGCAAGKTLQKLDNTVYWLGTDRIHGPAVYRAAGLQPERVSNNAIDAALRSYGDLSEAFAYTYSEGGHAFYVLTVTGYATWVYDAAVNEWHRRATWNSPDYDIVDVVWAYGRLLGQKRTGQIVELTPTLNTDEGEIIRRRRVSGTLELGGKRFSVMRAEVLASVGTAALTETPEIEIRWSKDRGKTWSDPQIRSYGSTGDYEKRLIWGPAGGFRKMTMELTTTSDIVATWAEVVLDIEVHDH